MQYRNSHLTRTTVACDAHPDDRRQYVAVCSSVVKFRFDFRDSPGRIYRQPLASWTATTAGEVPGVISAAEAALATGLHVAGWLSYEAAPGFDADLRVHSAQQQLPLACFAAFDGPEELTELAGHAFSVADWQPDQSEEFHAAAISQIREHIAAGDTYQVNYSMRLHSQLTGSAEGLYRELLQRQPAPFAAMLETDGHTLLSASPELFFRRRRDRIVTRPMKGTIRRSADADRDRQLRQDLLNSQKDRAENVMITDLLRNDLGRVSRFGSVRVEQLLELESQPTFHALTSTVAGQLKQDAGLMEILRALFPCGSITGAPKASTMEIITRLEGSPRGSYCGSIGFAEPEGGDWLFNVAIRTVQHDRNNDSLQFGSGGGITWDSRADREHGEALLKASFLPGAPEAWRRL